MYTECVSPPRQATYYRDLRGKVEFYGDGRGDIVCEVGKETYHYAIDDSFDVQRGVYTGSWVVFDGFLKGTKWKARRVRNVGQRR